MLHIFGRDAWLAQPKAGHCSLRLNLTTGVARARLVAEWAKPKPGEITAHYSSGSGNNERRDLAFYAFGGGLFTGWETPNGDDDAVELWSPDPPDRLEFGEMAGPAFSMTAGVLPASLAASAPQQWGEPAGFDFASLVAGKLRDGDLTGAIKLFIYSRCGIADEEVTGAAREVLIHLSRYPLRRDPLLGAFLASLCTEAGER